MRNHSKKWKIWWSLSADRLSIAPAWIDANAQAIKALINTPLTTVRLVQTSKKWRKFSGQTMLRGQLKSRIWKKVYKTGFLTTICVFFLKTSHPIRYSVVYLGWKTLKNHPWTSGRTGNGYFQVKTDFFPKSLFIKLFLLYNCRSRWKSSTKTKPKRTRTSTKTYAAKGRFYEKLTTRTSSVYSTFWKPKTTITS